jgi:hypothetical protein
MLKQQDSMNRLILLTARATAGRSTSRLAAILLLSYISGLAPIATTSAAPIYAVTEDTATETFTVSPGLLAISTPIHLNLAEDFYGPGAHALIFNVPPVTPPTFTTGMFIVPEPDAAAVNIVFSFSSLGSDHAGQLNVFSDVSTASQAYKNFISSGTLADIIVTGPKGSAPFQFFETVPDGGSSLAMFMLAAAGCTMSKRKLGR